MIPESTNDAVMLFSDVDGSLLNATFIDLTTSIGTAPATPIEALVVPNGGILISDQGADVIFRWSGDGTTNLGESTTPLDNMRGFDISGGSVWVTNAGTVGGAPGQALVQLDSSLNLVATITGVGSPFDAQAFNFGGTNGLLVTDLTNDDIHFVDPVAMTVVPFHDSDGVTGIDFPEQCTIKGSNGNPIAGGFTAPGGIYEYDSVTGGQIDYVDTVTLFGNGGIRGVYELGNGNILYTNGSGVHIYDPVAITSVTVVSGVSARFISDISNPGLNTTPFCAPANNNSTGMPGQLSGGVTGGNLHLEATSGPAGEFGYFLIGTDTNTTSPIALGSGLLCLAVGAGNSIGRYNVATTQFNSLGQFDASGVLQNVAGTSTIGSGFDVPVTVPISGSPMILAGQTWHFQCWFRDTPGGPGNSNFTNGLSVDF